MAQRRSSNKSKTNSETDSKSPKRAQNPLADASHNRDTNSAARAEQALRLRVLGYTYQEIARRCGYRDHTGAMKAVKKLRARFEREETRTLVDMQAERIEIAINAVMEAITEWPAQKKLWAVDRLTPLLKRQAELLGLDAKNEAVAGNMVVVREVPAGYLGEVVNGNSALPPVRERIPTDSGILASQEVQP